jgi:hypothetical protein
MFNFWKKIIAKFDVYIRPISLQLLGKDIKLFVSRKFCLHQIWTHWHLNFYGTKKCNITKICDSTIRVARIRIVVVRIFSFKERNDGEGLTVFLKRSEFISKNACTTRLPCFFPLIVVRWEILVNYGHLKRLLLRFLEFITKIPLNSWISATSILYATVKIDQA